MTGKKLRPAVAALGLLALPVVAATPAAARPVAAAPTATAASPGVRVPCSDSRYYWCDQVDATGTHATLSIHNGADTGGHDVAYIDFWGNCGQNVWILTSNGSGGWTWEGIPADLYLTQGYCYIETRSRSDRGVLIKLAAYNYDTGAYMYTNAH
ncbi:hypothetical protein [Kitasatospora purpeofusca]|uniref:hypothetical protein n=1 Tax=Kitasatospora purpeofusca TaxID=67352 RepID=UPI003663BCAE